MLGCINHSLRFGWVEAAGAPFTKIARAHAIQLAGTFAAFSNF